MPSFEVQIKKTQRADHPNSVDFPIKEDAFVLVFNYNWNDYGWFTSFALWYFPNHEKRFIGELKIINDSQEVTYKLIKEGFNKLNDTFCSLGQNVNYYHNLKKYLSEEKYKEVLTALRDCALDKRIYEEFKSQDMMGSSLLRESYASRAFDEAPFILNGLNPEDAFSFKYLWQEPYGEKLTMDWDIHFDYQTDYFKRSIGIIGENGVGKTRMLSSFTKDFFDPNSKSFNHKPLFSGIIVVNSTKHDRYPSKNDIYKDIEISHATPYLFYQQLSLDDYEDIDNIVNAILSLHKKPTLHRESIITWYRRSIITCISPCLNDLFELNKKTLTYTSWDGEETKEEVSIWEPKSKEQLTERIRILSSGELYSLALITFLYANIHLSTLVILDEPEIHLHPSVLINLMNCIYDVLERYNSYAIIATHSPLIIREIVKQNVYRFKRMDGERPTLSRVAFDTFGEDIATLFINIFEYDERNSLFSKVVRKMATIRGIKSTEDVVKRISASDSVNLNARMRITQIIEEINNA